MTLTDQKPPTPIHPEAVAAARAAVLPDDHLSMIVEAFQTLSDLTRVRILFALTRGPLCVRDLALVVGVSESAVSHQLRVLRERHLVKSRRVGSIIYYTVDDPHVAMLFREADYHIDRVRQSLLEDSSS